MKAANIHEIKLELSATKQPRLVQLCLRLARFKKENKELLTYLLFEAHDDAGYISRIKQEADLQFAEINLSQLYFAKKSLRKILRGINKHLRYMGSKLAEVELLIYFCTKLNDSGIPFEKNQVILNMYNTQIKKVQVLLKSLHEDLQYDFLKELKRLR